LEAETLIKEVEEQDELRFAVVCVWCGAEMRRASRPESSGMCHTCFKRMVEEHARLATRQISAHASER